MEKKYTDQEKIDFFDANWEWLSKIIDLVNNTKKYEIRAGTNIFIWVVEYLEARLK